MTKLIFTTTTKFSVHPSTVHTHKSLLRLPTVSLDLEVEGNLFHLFIIGFNFFFGSFFCHLH